jgi:hypothetical protein
MSTIVMIVGGIVLVGTIIKFTPSKINEKVMNLLTRAS